MHVGKLKYGATGVRVCTWWFFGGWFDMGRARDFSICLVLCVSELGFSMCEVVGVLIFFGFA